MTGPLRLLLEDSPADADLTEVERGSGRLYEPAAVAACLKVVRANGMKLPEIEAA